MTSKSRIECQGLAVQIVAIAAGETGATAATAGINTIEGVKILRELMSWPPDARLITVGAVIGLTGERIRLATGAVDRLLFWNQLETYDRIISGLEARGEEREIVMYRTAMQMTNAGFAYDGEMMGAIAVATVAQYGEAFLDRCLHQCVTNANVVLARMMREQSKRQLNSLTTTIPLDLSHMKGGPTA